MYKSIGVKSNLTKLNMLPNHILINVSCILMLLCTRRFKFYNFFTIDDPTWKESNVIKTVLLPKQVIKRYMKFDVCSVISFFIFPLSLDLLWRNSKCLNTLQRRQEPSILLRLTNVMPCCFVLHTARVLSYKCYAKLFCSIGPPIWLFLIKIKFGTMIHEGHWLGFGAKKAESE